MCSWIYAKVSGQRLHKWPARVDSATLLIFATGCPLVVSVRVVLSTCTYAQTSYMSTTLLWTAQLASIDPWGWLWYDFRVSTCFCKWLITPSRQEQRLKSSTLPVQSCRKAWWVNPQHICNCPSHSYSLTLSLAQSADMIFWAVHHVGAESKFLSSRSQHYSIHWGYYRWVQLWAHLFRLSLNTVRRNDVLGCATCLSQCSCLAVVSTTAFNGDINVYLPQLWAHLCRLSLDTVRRNDVLDCTPCGSWERMSNWQCLSHCFYLAVVTSFGISASSTVVSSYLQTVLWHSPQKWSSGLYTMLKLRAHVKSQPFSLSSHSQQYSNHWGHQGLV